MSQTNPPISTSLTSIFRSPLAQGPNSLSAYTSARTSARVTLSASGTTTQIRRDSVTGAVDTGPPSPRALALAQEILELLEDMRRDIDEVLDGNGDDYDDEDEDEEDDDEEVWGCV